MHVAEIEDMMAFHPRDIINPPELIVSIPRGQTTEDGVLFLKMST